MASNANEVAARFSTPPGNPRPGGWQRGTEFKRCQVQNTGLGGAYGGGPLKPAPGDLAPP